MTAIHKRVIRIGTRKSRLAMAQTELVSSAIKSVCPEAEIELILLVTRGDKILKKPLTEFGGKGVFVEEFEQALLCGDIDMAVHSAKDMPMELSAGLEIAAVLKREDPRDVLVTVKGRECKNHPMIIGTGSLRRQAQIMERMDAECRPLRGNVDTRLQKLYDGGYDGIILAAAGLKRLGLLEDERFSFEFLPEREFVPAGGQGIIAVEAKENGEFSEILEKINDETAMRALLAERQVLSGLNAGCHAALGVYGAEEDGKFVLTLMKEETLSGGAPEKTGGASGNGKAAESGTGSPQSRIIRRTVSGKPSDYLSLAGQVLKEPGHVALVGAGPGDPGLLTLKGCRELTMAEVLVYDRLASEEFLALIPENCEKIYVGKTPGHHSRTQEEINELLIEKALKGKRTVRLKGGDPFVFGRGGEEIQALTAAGIPCDPVPGITSAVAALESAGIPVTHRGMAQSFHVITGHTAAGDTLPGDFPLYGKLNGTLIFLMGLSNLERIVEKLIAGGKDERTPAAVVTDGTLPSMRVVRADLRDLPSRVREAGLVPPGIIVVGEVAAFKFRRGEKSGKCGPLAGVSVGITGTDRMYEKLSGELGSLGARTVRAAVSKVIPEPAEALEAAFKNINRYGWVIFTSQNAVRLFFQTMKESGTDIRSLGRLKFAVIGQGTYDALTEFGVHADYMPKEYTAKALAEGLCREVLTGNGRNSDNREGTLAREWILIPRARQGSRILTDILKKAGISFDDIPVYDIAAEPVSFEKLSGCDYVTFESGSGVRGFFETHPEEAGELLLRVRPVCIGKITEAALKEYRVSDILTADSCTAKGIAEAIVRDRKHGNICL